MTDATHEPLIQTLAEREEANKALLRRIDAEYPEGYPPIQVIPPAPITRDKGKGRGKGKGKAKAIASNEINSTLR